MILLGVLKPSRSRLMPLSQFNLNSHDLLAVKRVTRDGDGRRNQQNSGKDSVQYRNSLNREVRQIGVASFTADLSRM